MSYSALLKFSHSNYQQLGESGLKISKIVVGCMSLGSKQWFDWAVEDEEEVMKILLKCYESGLRTFDTADTYSNGQSEILLGKFIKKYNIPRDRIVILSKCFVPVFPENLGFSIFKPDGNPYETWELLNSRGLSRKHIFDAVKASTERLGTYMDVLQIHRLDDTPKEEIMRALNNVVEAGYTRYIGASSMKAVEFAELQFIAKDNKWSKFISMQNYYNLLNREEEREMIPFCHNNGIGKVTCIPWSPLDEGLLARPLGTKSDSERLKAIKRNLSKADETIISRVEELSKKHGFSMTNIATAWAIAKGHCPIIGINSEKRVEDTIKAFDVKLTEKDIKYLEEPYLPKANRNS